MRKSVKSGACPVTRGGLLCFARAPARSKLSAEATNPHIGKTCLEGERILTVYLRSVDPALRLRSRDFSPTAGEKRRRSDAPWLNAVRIQI